jgi:hypothetical protein
VYRLLTAKAIKLEYTQINGGERKIGLDRERNMGVYMVRNYRICAILYALPTWFVSATQLQIPSIKLTIIIIIIIIIIYLPLPNTVGALCPVFYQPVCFAASYPLGLVKQSAHCKLK